MEETKWVADGNEFVEEEKEVRVDFVYLSTGTRKGRL